MFANLNICKFGNRCGYSHQISVQIQYNEDLEDKVNVLEKTVYEMSIKLSNLENELKTIKNEQTKNESGR